MSDASGLRFRIATDDDELAQVHRLNHRTFAEEIPQHRPNANGALVDRFDPENTYIVARKGRRVVGMIALRDRRPFSLDEKLPDLDAWLPRDRRCCEVRLLAVEPEFRNGVVFHGLMRELSRICIALGFDAAVISGTTRQLRLYEHIGFVAFGPRVGTPGAEYQPMILTVDAYRAGGEVHLQRAAAETEAVSFLPGPVDLHPDVERAWQRPHLSHRSPAFTAELRRVRRRLCELTGAAHAEILLGSGTLANDVVAAQLGVERGPGLVLANGEFGERLVDHALRAGLRFAVERRPWGGAFDAAAIAQTLELHPGARWLWMVHHETATGVLNDLAAAAARGAARGVAVCADCVSSIGVVPVDLRALHLATCVSGKALGAVPGLAIVFHRGRVAPTPSVPRYLDLAAYAGTEGVPFTQSSSLVAALGVAVEQTIARGDLSDSRERARWLRRELERLGMRVLAPEAVASPGIITLCLEPPGEAERLGDALASVGIQTSYRSAYLRERNWLQIALMGQCSMHKLRLLVHVLEHLLRRPQHVGAALPPSQPAARPPVRADWNLSAGELV